MNKINLLFKNKIYAVLVLVTLLAAFIRIYKLSEVPVSLYWDEVSSGYNAYSIGTNLKDEYGNFLPILFRGYNDYKMPVYIYLTAISIKIFGFNEFSVRFPSALFGILTVVMTFFLARGLLGLKKMKYKNTCEDAIPLLSSFLLAISPWHIQFSRGGFEANIALFFVILGIYLFLKGTLSYRYYLFSFASFGLALYGYRSVLVFVIPLLFGMLLIWKKEFSKYGLLRIVFGIILLLFIVIPLIQLLSGVGSSRFQQTSISNKVNEKALENFEKGKPENQKLLYIKIFIQDYIAEFNPQFLFVSGDSEARHGPRGMGLLYLWDAPFLLIGFYFLWKKYSLRAFIFVCLWIVCAPLAAALSVPVPHALRFLNILPIPQIIVAIGVISIGCLISKKFKIAYIILLVFVISYFFMNYVKLYNLTNTKLAVSNWGDGYKQLAIYIKTNKGKYDKVIVSGHYWQPYMYILFYEKFDTAIFQTRGNAQHFDKYIFGGTSWDLAVGRPELDKVNLKELSGNKKTLVALSPGEYKNQESNLKFMANIMDHNGKTVFIVGELK